MEPRQSYRMRIVCFGIISSVSVILGSAGSAAEYVWAHRADMATPRLLHASAVVNGSIYAIGGFPEEGPGPMLASLEEYDPASDTWTKRADMPTRRGSLSASVVGGKIYAIGGSGDGGSRMEEYDPVNDTWTRKADMPTERHHLTSCALNGKIYAIGGTPLWNVWSGLRTVEEYDPVTDTWTRRADMPTGVWGLRANVVRGKIYVFGGRPEIEAVPYVHEYDPVTDTWTRRADMPLATSQMASVVLGDEILVFGGWYWSLDYPHTAVQVYDPETDTWTAKGDTPFLRAAVSASAVNNRIYVIGGTPKPHPLAGTTSVYAYDIITDCNGDGHIDGREVSGMVDRWGTDDPLFDIGPRPWGDGIVNVEDVKVLAEYIGQDVHDPTLIAHWAFDEAEGTTTQDMSGVCDGTVVGTPLWHPDAGRIDGALELDGSTLVMVDHVLSHLLVRSASWLGSRAIRRGR